ncbi:glycosyltransferase, putative [Citrifermentans bemidjiense Bem]|uniref:Glycosyltransferase, putative n=1 Tax=Citrifermentans bemidjiense (strain ATCC BAA-1014 / DSM 16622 / JCM 12645 / Bem) TaxID=404380 RepID=B5E9G5_CITBB|nr:glycosyltransferase [Citrifermentans bemidjiense]ACH38707.1 glycosyltransferase, putative [Citrifermentans bemidjiense Bem]
MKIVIFGLSITSSWGNGHATTYRGLLREMDRRGHEVQFFERDAKWYAANRDLPEPSFCNTILYDSLETLLGEYGPEICDADCVIVGSYVYQGIEVGKWVTKNAKGITAFYDIDTPVTLASLAKGECRYLNRELVPHYDLYLSFTGGPTLDQIERQFGSPAARALYCSVDPQVHYPMQITPRWDLGYLGTYSPDRQLGLEELLSRSARSWKKGRFVVAGAQYPADVAWSENTHRIEHLPPECHSEFYSSQRFTLNLTRKQMLLAGYSPSVRLFEAASCAVPVVSDQWPGLDHFFVPGEEILLASDSQQMLRILQRFPENERRAIGERARQRVLRSHSAACRAEELEEYLTAR